MAIPQVAHSLVIPTTASFANSSVTIDQAHHVLMNAKYFSIFLILLVIVDFILLICITSLVICIIHKCCTCHCPKRRNKRQDLSVRFQADRSRTSRSRTGSDEQIEILRKAPSAPPPLYPSILSMRSRESELV